MAVYFGMIGLVLLMPLIVQPFCKTWEKAHNITLLFSIFVVYLVMALKAPEVGRDIEGYKRIYDLMQYQSWSNYDTSYFEWGYELLMMIFSKVFHASFQQFMACVYAFVYFSYYRFIKRYSKDYTLSVLIYICFTFFTFDLSAVRNILGIAICLLAVPFAEKKGTRNAFWFMGLVLIASQIHKSAYVFFIVYFIIKIPLTLRTVALYGLVTVLLLSFREQLYNIVILYFKPVDDAVPISFGGNLLFYSMNIAAAFFVWFVTARETEERDLQITQYERLEFGDINLEARLLYSAIVIQLFATDNVLSRLAAYLQIFIIVLLPAWIDKLEYRGRFIVKMVLYAFLIWYFYRYSLAVNSLNIVPYVFFWKE